MWITKSENLDLVKEVRLGFFDLNKKSVDFIAKTINYLIQLGQLVENPNSGNTQVDSNYMGFGVGIAKLF